MNSAHIHLILNHVPILGTIFGLLLLLGGMSRRNESIIKASLWVFILTALVAIPTYLTGEPAEDLVVSLPGVSREAIEGHDDSALIAFVSVGLLGLWSLYCLWRYFREPVAGWGRAVVLILALVSSGAMVWTAELGGRIHHAEIRPGFQAPAPVQAEH
jgi:hypothetical protein